MKYTTDIPKEGTWKFVKVNGEYRWIEVGMWNAGQHKDAVKEEERPEAAGTINIFNDYWRMIETYSMTLKIGTTMTTKDEITSLLNKPGKERY